MYSKVRFSGLFRQIVSSYFEQPVIQMKVVDGAAFVNMRKPRLSKTFEEYCKEELPTKIFL